MAGNSHVKMLVAGSVKKLKIEISISLLLWFQFNVSRVKFLDQQIQYKEPNITN